VHPFFLIDFGISTPVENGANFDNLIRNKKPYLFLIENR
jgi:hypothetical protein